MTRRLETELLRQQEPMWFDGAGSGGIVSVRFTLDERNRPAAPLLARSSHDRRLDRAALRAIGRLGVLPAVSTGAGVGPTIQANMIFASDYLDYREKLGLLRREIRVARQTGGSERLASIVMIGAAATN
ncbi:energy transducer TonB [Sphingomonas sp. RHCKR7]|uniref:energy transducer TonB family protein n=1 Tax=Sphingomonas folli TaxID=2862497 RepID=UPI001C675997|nr:energy transducer TonB [Sphingomonas folli]MBW6528785.1 energy transducer TonB [Sphingomonas folli]